MLKKTLAVLLAGLLINPSYIFAQSDTAPKPSLKQLQGQARSAHNVLLQDNKVVNYGLLGIAGVTIAYMTYSKIRKNIQMKNELSEILDMIKNKGNLIHAGELEEYKYLERYIEEALKNPDFDVNRSAEFVTKKFGSSRLYTEEQMRYLNAWLRAMHNHSGLLQSKNKRKLLAELSDFIFDCKIVARSILGDETSYLWRLLSVATLKKAGFLGIGLLLLSTTANAAPNDTKMAQRIMSKPELFLNASDEELQEIEQNPMVEEVCRTYANGLIQFSQLSAEDKKAVIEEAEKLSPQHRAKQDLTRSLFPVKAR